MDYQARIHTLLDRTGLDAIGVIPSANMGYFTGLDFKHASERPLIAFLTRNGLNVIVPKLEATKITAKHQAQAFIWSDDVGYMGAFEQAAQALKGMRLGVDGQTMRLFEWQALGQAGFDLNQTANVGRALLEVRAIKTLDEVDAMQTAIHMSEHALERTMQKVRVGMKEREIASILADELALAGSHGHAFSITVLIGEKSALPHGSTGDRVLGENDFLLIDFGGTYEGYPADITRTFCLGTPTAEMQKIFDAVYRANEAARKVARAGVRCGDVDKAARDVIESAGYGEFFTHRTGHGLGLEVHELPQIAKGVDDILAEGMVFTIEPGIYLESIGGVRIEDNMFITANGAESLTSYPRELKP